MSNNKVRLRATQGADEANWSGASRPFRVDNDGYVEVPEEAVAPLVEKGGFLRDPEPVELPKGKVRVKHANDPAASCGHAGEVFAAEKDGSFLVPTHAVPHLAAHGFVPQEPAAKGGKPVAEESA